MSSLRKVWLCGVVGSCLLIGSVAKAADSCGSVEELTLPPIPEANCTIVDAAERQPLANDPVPDRKTVKKYCKTEKKVCKDTSKLANKNGKKAQKQQNKYEKKQNQLARISAKHKSCNDKVFYKIQSQLINAQQYVQLCGIADSSAIARVMTRAAGNDFGVLCDDSLMNDLGTEVQSIWGNIEAYIAAEIQRWVDDVFPSEPTIRASLTHGLEVVNPGGCNAISVAACDMPSFSLAHPGDSLKEMAHMFLGCLPIPFTGGNGERDVQIGLNLTGPRPSWIPSLVWNLISGIGSFLSCPDPGCADGIRRCIDEKRQAREQNAKVAKTACKIVRKAVEKLEQAKLGYGKCDSRRDAAFGRLNSKLVQIANRRNTYACAYEQKVADQDVLCEQFTGATCNGYNFPLEQYTF